MCRLNRSGEIFPKPDVFEKRAVRRIAYGGVMVLERLYWREANHLECRGGHANCMHPTAAPFAAEQAAIGRDEP